MRPAGEVTDAPNSTEPWLVVGVGVCARQSRALADPPELPPTEAMPPEPYPDLPGME